MINVYWNHATNSVMIYNVICAYDLTFALRSHKPEGSFMTLRYTKQQVFMLAVTKDCIAFDVVIHVMNDIEFYRLIMIWPVLGGKPSAVT